MINFVSTDRESIVVIGIGLNPEDLARLKEKQSLRLKVSDMGIDTQDVEMEILIFGGESNEVIIKELQKELGPNLKLQPYDKSNLN